MAQQLDKAQRCPNPIVPVYPSDEHRQVAENTFKLMRKVIMDGFQIRMGELEPLTQKLATENADLTLALDDCRVDIRAKDSD